MGLHHSPIPLFVDNLAALSVTNHPNSGAKSRHVALREFRIRDHHEANKIRPYWCPGPLNVADFFSKTLQKNLFNINLKRLGMVGSFRDEVESRALHNDSPLQSSESSSCWHLRVTLTPERPSYNSCIVHLLHPAH